MMHAGSQALDPGLRVSATGPLCYLRIHMHTYARDVKRIPDVYSVDGQVAVINLTFARRR